MDEFAFLVPVMMGTFGLVFFAMAWARQVSALSWALGYTLVALAYLMPILPMPIEIQTVLADFCFLAGFFYFGEALLEGFDMQALRPARLILAILAFAAAAFAVLVLRNAEIDVVIIDVSVSVLLGISVVAVAPRAKSPTERVMVTIAAVVVADTVLRLLIFTVFFEYSAALEEVAGSLYDYFMQISARILSLVFALAAMGLVISRTMARYREAAERDPLTSLLNRRGFEMAVAALGRAKLARSVVLTCDIDHFKAVNDGYGHAAGDRVLVELGRLLTDRLPKSGFAARFGGEEFVALLPEGAMAAGAALAQKLRADFAAHDWPTHGIERRITLSVGVAPMLGEGMVEEAIARADRALYAAKAGGRDQVRLDAGEGEPVMAMPLRAAS